MKNFIKNMLQDEKKDDAGGGTPPITGYGDPVKPETKPVEGTPPTTPPVEEKRDNVDEFGYAKAPEKTGDAKPPGDEKKPEDKKADPTKPPDPVTGYEKEPTKVEPAAPTQVEEPKLEIEVDMKDLKPEQTKALTAFFAKHKVSKELAEEVIADQKATNLAQAGAEAERQRQDQLTRQKWFNELQTDPKFGGENFDQNINVVNRVVEDFCPGIKKMLTDRKAMLPPYVMRDLANMGEHLYGTKPFVEGNPTSPPKQEGDGKDDPNAFLSKMYK